MQGGVIVALVLIIIISFQFQRSSATAADKSPDKCLYINEVLTDNIGGLKDEDEDYNDWIEIYNYGKNAVNLEGYGLTDDLDEPFKWTFEKMIIEPGEYLVIRATGKDRQLSKEYIHTNFSLSKKGEVLQLTHRDSEVIDTISIPKLDQNISVGRKNSSDNSLAILNKATPGQGNYVSVLKNVIQEQPLEAPKFSHEAGFYQEEFQLELWTEDEDITIYYTLDGSEPDINSRVYIKPITIKDRSDEENKYTNIKTDIFTNELLWDVGTDKVFKGTVVKVRTNRNGVFSTDIITKTYLINSNYQLPVISLSTEPENLFGYENGIYVSGKIYQMWRSSNIGKPIDNFTMANYNQRGKEWEREAYIEYFDTDGECVLTQGVGVRISGNLTRSFTCKSLKVIAREEYDDKDKLYLDVFDNNITSFENLTEIESYKNLIFRTSGNDFNKTMFKDGLLQTLVNELNIDTQAYKPSILFINGEYWGIHNIREVLDEYYVENHYGINKNEVTIISSDYESQSMVLECGNEDNLNEYNELIEFVRSVDMSINENYRYIESQIDISNFIDYYISQIYFANLDWPHNNLKIWKSDDGKQEKWRWMMFDTDSGFGEWASFKHNTIKYLLEAGYKEENCYFTSHEWSLGLFQGLMDNKIFRERFILTFEVYLETVFNEQVVLSQIEEFMERIEPEIEEHLARWTLKPTPIRKLLGFIKPPEDYSTDWYMEIEVLKEFAKNRPTYLKKYLDEIKRGNPWF